MRPIPALISRDRQSTILSHETAMRMHDALQMSTLIELEDCGDCPAKDNTKAAAAAVNWFLTGGGNSDAEFAESDPIDPNV